MRVRKFGSVAAVVTASLVVTAVGVHTATATEVETGVARTDVPIAQYLQQTLDGLAFQEVLDLAPPESAQFRALRSGVDKDAVTPAQQARRNALAADPQPISQQPQINATVLELDDKGRITDSGTVLMSPQYPHGVVVPVDGNHHTTGVRWRQWDDQGWYTNHGQGTIDVVPGRESAPLDFMLPYPASVLKLMVSFGVLRLADRGVIKRDMTYDYRPTTISNLCGGPSSNTVDGYIDAALTRSSNGAACALIKLLWDHDAVNALNQDFQDLGLETLQLVGTNPVNGGHWDNTITMSSLDTAKLLAIVNGGAGTLWTAPNGQPVTGAVLKSSSRRFFASKLGEDGWNWMLSTTNYCGAAYPAAGIPQVTAKRWIAADGTVTVDGNRFGQDVRPCNKAAQVTFAHKPGWVDNSGADAGIVRSLPGKPRRHYIIAVLSNLGGQYQDPGRPATPPGTTPVQFTEKFAKLGRAIDQYEVAKCNRVS
jgi:Beta-lactamase enzyme family